MHCPSCKTTFKKALFYGVEIDYCPKCLGVFFEQDELRQAKDERDRDLNWVDVNLWEDLKKMNISKEKKLCPKCKLPLYEVNYDKSKIMVDVCNVCKGVWLDRGEFKKIVSYLKDKAFYDTFKNYNKVFVSEFLEMFVGPESFKEEAADFLAVLKTLNYKFATQHPVITQIISQLPK